MGKSVYGIETLKQHQSQRVAECRANVERWNQFSGDYGALRHRLSTLSQSLEHQVMVPFGPLAMMPGRLVRTNEVLVLLGDNWFCKTSTHHALTIVDRRLAHCAEMREKAEAELKLMQDWCSQVDSVTDSDQTREIREPLDESKEAEWKESRRRRLADERRRENRQRSVCESHDELMKRLDQLELAERQTIDCEKPQPIDLPFKSLSCSNTVETIGSSDVSSSSSSSAILDSDDSSSSDSDTIDTSVSSDTTQPHAAAKRVTFSDRVSTTAADGDGAAYPTTVKSILRNNDAAAPPGDSVRNLQDVGARIEPVSSDTQANVQTVASQPKLQRPELSEVFSYKIVERETPHAASPPDPPVSSTRPISKFRARREAEQRRL